MKPFPEWDVGASWSLIPAPAADVPRLAGMRSTLAPLFPRAAKTQRCGWRRVAAVEPREAIHYAKRYGFVLGWFGRQPETYAHRNSTGEMDGLLVVSRPRDRIFDDGLTREVRILRYESKEQARALLFWAIRCSRDAGATRAAGAVRTKIFLPKRGRKVREKAAIPGCRRLAGRARWKRSARPRLSTAPHSGVAIVLRLESMVLPDYLENQASAAPSTRQRRWARIGVVAVVLGAIAYVGGNGVGRSTHSAPSGGTDCRATSSQDGSGRRSPALQDIDPMVHACASQAAATTKDLVIDRLRRLTPMQ